MLDPLWPNRSTGRPCLSLTKSLYITQNSFRELSYRIAIGAAMGYKSLIKTLKAICLLKSKVIVFPSTEISKKSTIEQFRPLRGSISYYKVQSIK